MYVKGASPFKIDNGNYENALAGKANAVMMGVMMMITAMTNNLKIDNDNYENILGDDWGDDDDDSDDKHLSTESWFKDNTR